MYGCLDWVGLLSFCRLGLVLWCIFESEFWRPFCWSLVCFCLQKLVNTGSRFFTFNSVLRCILSLVNDWQISLVDDVCRLFDKGLVGLVYFDNFVQSREDLELGNFVVDGAGFDLFSHNFMYSSTLSFCSGVLIVGVEKVVWVDTSQTALMVLG